ncbi:glycerophosphoryl diester phosphodiesterase membrane domain-containing protein [Georgenia satyanarayanai]|uniref:glycerophosphodiester phosphodiesterase family protein n=1 Tax=Georgenia satyanarayanai TaxID=860221 RepID=UPI00203DC641|nr:glycerophosphodiester phosphodiesterase family protein [Georgenia satyanarayanai]MCM3660747.1 glycerophosphoryl diester phosphodiesterase membrane domain-containing protein [Georgenia satyanarayanai]
MTGDVPVPGGRGLAAGTALRVLVTHWRAWLRVAVTLQLLTALVAGPVVGLLLAAALRAAGVPTLTEASLGQVLRHPAAVLLLVALTVVATSAALLQHAAFVLFARGLADGRVTHVPELARQGAAVLVRSAGPQLGLLALYLLVLAPLGGFALGASFVRPLEVPAFIGGELQKTPLGTAAWLGAGALLGYANLRLLLVPTLVLSTGLTPAGAYAASWRATRGRVTRLALAVAALWLVAAAGVAALATAAVAVTRLSDALLPAASPVVAGAALAIAQVVLLGGGGLVAAFVALLLLGMVPGPPPAPAGPVPPGRARARGALAGVLVAVLATGTGVAGAASLRTTDPSRVTLVIAHRGATYGAVENTLESLEAAARLGADVVELDVLQAADGGLVVVHDTNLRRIAGVNRDVADLTTEELTATTVRQAGHESTIPTFAAFAERAAELGVPLLVEIKRHGRERGDLVGDVVAVLEAHDLVGTSLVQAFDRATVAEIETRFPHVTTGGVVAFSRGRLDPGAADFLTLEQSSYTPDLLRQAHTAGVQLFLWTVTEPRRVRAFVRDGVDGVITPSPSVALEQRGVVAAETGVSDRLSDLIRSLVS